MKAELQRKGNSFQAAISYYNKAIKLSPNEYKFHYNKAVCLIKINDIQMAIITLRKCVKVKPDFVSGYYRLAKIYMKKKRYNETIKYLDLAYKYESKLSKKLNYKLSILKLLNNSTDYAKVEKHVMDALRLTKTNVDVLYYHAMISNKRKKYFQAIEAVNKSLQLLGSYDPKKTAKYFYELGYAYFQIGDYQKSNKAFKRANYGPFKEKVKHMSPSHFCDMAKSYYDVYDYTKCRQMIAMSLKIDPHYLPAYNLNVKLTALKTDQSKQIITIGNQVKNETNELNKIQLYSQLCQIHFFMNDLDKCISYAEKVLEKQPYNYMINYLKAKAYYKKGNPTIAINILENLTNERGVDYTTRAKFFFTLGIIYKSKGMPKESKAMFKKIHADSYRAAADNEICELTSMN